MKRILIAAVMLVSTVPLAHSASIWDQCSSSAPCVVKVSQMVAQIRVSHQACLPPNLADQDAVQVVQNYVTRHPEALNERPSAMVRKALASAYPCR